MEAQTDPTGMILSRVPDVASPLRLLSSVPVKGREEDTSVIGVRDNPRD